MLNPERNARQRMVILNKRGLDTAASAEFAKLVERQRATITVERQGKRADGGAMSDLVELKVPQGGQVMVYAEGKGASDTLDAIQALVKARFGLELEPDQEA